MSARPPFVAMTAYALRASVPGKRWIGVLLPCAAAVLFGLLASTIDDTAARSFAEVAGIALFGLVLPVTCLVIGDAVLGAEVRSGAFAFTWLAPVPAWQVVAARWLGGSVVASAALGVAFALAAVVAGAGDLAVPVALGAVFGAQAYVAVFLAIGVIARRAAVWSLAFVFLGERLLGAALSGVAQLSPSWQGRAVFIGLGDVPGDLVRSGIPHGGDAVVRLVLISVVALALAAQRLGHLRLTGAAD